MNLPGLDSVKTLINLTLQLAGFLSSTVVIPSETDMQPTHLHLYRDRRTAKTSSGQGLQPLQLDSQHPRQHPGSSLAVTAGGGRCASQQANPAYLLNFGAGGLVRPRGSQVSDQQHHQPESDV